MSESNGATTKVYGITGDDLTTGLPEIVWGWSVLLQVVLPIARFS